MSVRRYAVIPTHNRHALLDRCIVAIGLQVDDIIVIDNASDPPVTLPYDPCRVIRDEEQPPNLSRLWNFGLGVAEKLAANDGVTRWYVAVLNDDAIPPPAWMDAVTAAMDATGAAAGCTDPHGIVSAPLHKTKPDRDVMTRMVGWAYVLRGETGLRADETLRWWWGDTDLDWHARAAGGTVIVPSPAVPNLEANSSTRGELAAQAGRDRATFEAKWGPAPW